MHHGQEPPAFSESQFRSESCDAMRRAEYHRHRARPPLRGESLSFAIRPGDRSRLRMYSFETHPPSSLSPWPSPPGPSPGPRVSLPAHGINIDVQVNNKSDAKATREKPTHKMSYKYIVVGGGVVRAACWHHYLCCTSHLNSHHLLQLRLLHPLTHPPTHPPAHPPSHAHNRLVRPRWLAFSRRYAFTMHPNLPSRTPSIPIHISLSPHPTSLASSLTPFRTPTAASC